MFVPTRKNIFSQVDGSNFWVSRTRASTLFSRKNTKYIFLNGLIDLAQSRLGSKIVYKTNEFFASAKRIINPWPPIFKEGVFDKHGKWMDGWETRRKRSKGHDYLILKLGKPGIIHKVDIDTSYFNGNQPSKVSLDACFSKKKIAYQKFKMDKHYEKKIH